MIVINKSSYLIPKDGRPNKYTTFLFGAIFQYNFSLQKNLKATKPIPHHQIYDMACIYGPLQHSSSSFSQQMLPVCQMTKNDEQIELVKMTINKWHNRVGAGVHTETCSKMYTLRWLYFSISLCFRISAARNRKSSQHLQLMFHLNLSV